jgi:hypothetical protein
MMVSESAEKDFCNSAKIEAGDWLLFKGLFGKRTPPVWSWIPSVATAKESNLSLTDDVPGAEK